MGKFEELKKLTIGNVLSKHAQKNAVGGYGEGVYVTGPGVMVCNFVWKLFGISTYHQTQKTRVESCPSNQQAWCYQHFTKSISTGGVGDFIFDSGSLDYAYCLLG